MSRSAPTTPRQEPSGAKPEHSVVTTQHFFAYFKQAWNLVCPKVMHTALQKITKLEVENRILHGELEKLRQGQDKINKDFENRIDGLEFLRSYYANMFSAQSKAEAQKKQEADLLKASTDVAISELGSAHKGLEASVLQLQSIAKWKVDIERFEKVRWDLDNYVLKLKTYEKDVQSMKKTKV